MFKFIQQQRAALFLWRAPSAALMPMQSVQFSEYFRELDKRSINKINHEFYVNKEYKRITDQWKKPLEKKLIKRQKKLLNPVVPKDEQSEILYVHNLEQGVSLPPNPEQIFAVIRVKGLQYKVTKDDRVMVEKLDEDDGVQVGQQIELQDVMLVGTKDYTCIGRPRVTQARVLATVEETSMTEKALIFKKRRRKDSQRHMGYRQWVTYLKIDKIIHEIDEQAITSAQPKVDVDVLNLQPLVNKPMY